MPTKSTTLQTFFFEFTDTFGGEANYSWVKRFKVTAMTELGALRKVSKEIGLQGRLKRVMSGERSRWDVQGAALCLFCDDNYDFSDYPRLIVLE